MILVVVLLVIAGLAGLAYFRAPLWLSTALVAGLLFWLTYEYTLATWVMGLLWGLFILAALLLNIYPLRRALVSRYLLAMFRTMLPGMSRTESDAIEAGTVWWDADLFSGRPDWHRMLAFKEPKLSEEEQAFLDGPVEKLCHMLDDWHISNDLLDLPEEVWRFIRREGFFGMIIPKRYGGLEFSALAHSQVVMKVASRSMTAAVTIMVPNSLGPGELLLAYGTDEQKEHYMPRLASGEEVPCFALTGPDAGSDAAAMTDTGVVCYGEIDGRKDVLGIRLNWDKRYITLAPVATVLGLAFKLYDPDGLLGGGEDLGITLALIPTDTDGITIGRRHSPTGLPFQNGPTQGHNVFIPLDWIIGGQDYIGQGWRMLMENLAVGRSISLPALSVAAAKWSAYTTGAYARIRRQFKLSIGRFGGVEEVLARIGGSAYAMDAARTMTLGALADGEKPSVLSAILKYHLTERMRVVINDAMDVHGGKGVCEGPANYMAKPYQALPISITVEGANILTRSMIIFGQGAIRCHPYVLKEMQAVADDNPGRALRNFDRAIFGHIGFTVSNAVRSLVMGLSGALLVLAPAPAPARRYYQQLTRMSAAFALAADVAMLTLGGALKRREMLSARLGDVLSELYLASCALKRFEDQGRQADDEILLRYACESALLNIQRALDGLIRNFPNRLIGGVLRLLVFPLGQPYMGASDRLAHRVAQFLITPSAARNRLTYGIFTTRDPNETTGLLQAAMSSTVAAEPVDRKIFKALRAGAIKSHAELSLLEQAEAAGIINAREAETVRTADTLRRKVIMVDDFDGTDYTREGGA